MKQVPSGFRLRQTLVGHGRRTTDYQFAWSNDGRKIALASLDGTVSVWDSESGSLIADVPNHTTITGLVWTDDDSKVVAAQIDGTVTIWDLDGNRTRAIMPSGGPLSWRLVDALDKRDKCRIAYYGNVHYGNSVMALDLRQRLAWDLGSCGQQACVAWSPDGTAIAVGRSSLQVFHKLNRVSSPEDMLGLAFPEKSDPLCLAWSRNSALLAVGGIDRRIRIFERQTESLILKYLLEGNLGPVVSLSFSFDGRLLASQSLDGALRIWRTDSWEMASVLFSEKPASPATSMVVGFHPRKSTLATIGPDEHGQGTPVRIWDLDHKALLSVHPAISGIKYVSAKIVLLGESNVGKSCLAMRIAENRYPEDKEHVTTHGLRFWPVSSEKLSPKMRVADDERRDIVLWDMGGQDEYRLIHQLFLHDTNLALILFDPTRGQTAFEEVKMWNKRIEKQLRGRRASKFLIGAKMEKPSQIVNQPALKNLTRTCHFDKYFETSALTGRGVPELCEAIAGALEWERLAQTRRPELFQRIQDEIESHRNMGKAVLYPMDLERSILEKFPDLYEPNAVESVTEQLAMQGVVAVAHLSSGESVIVLQVHDIERYAGSLVISATHNPHGVPALEERMIASPNFGYPGIEEKDRLPRGQELVILECVVQLLIEHGLCFRHEGLLIFPSLFHATEQAGRAVSHSISLYYDFSGAIENIYASLVAWLVVGKEFGRVRLWQDRAEFENPNTGTCGLRKVDRGGGFAHLDVYFGEEVSQDTREQFVNFVEEHLRQHGVQIVEHVTIECHCGYLFDERMIRERIAKADEDIGCPRCDRRTRLTEGAAKAREHNPKLAHKTWALRTEIEKRVKDNVRSALQVISEPAGPSENQDRISILHLSDLHLAVNKDPIAQLRPLVAHIRDRDGGLGFDKITYLVISGDLTDKATPQEFEVARLFISGLIEEFKLSAERCIIVPGNHDVSFDERVYDWLPKRSVSLEKLPAGHYYPQGDGYLVRIETLYQNRLRNFSHDFYHTLIQKEYPLAPVDQSIPYLSDQTGIQILTFNSSWEIDEWFKDRASIHQGALTRGLIVADEQIKDSIAAGRLSKERGILRLAVWHHPVTGNDKIQDDAFLDQLRQAGVKLCLHGHVHEGRADVVGYLHPKRIHIAGAGSFGATAAVRPESTPRLFNLLEITQDHSRIKIHTHRLDKEGGAWEPYAIWPGPSSMEKRSYYEIELGDKP